MQNQILARVFRFALMMRKKTLLEQYAMELPKTSSNANFSNVNSFSLIQGYV